MSSEVVDSVVGKEWGGGGVAVLECRYEELSQLTLWLRRRAVGYRWVLTVGIGCVGLTMSVLLFSDKGGVNSIDLLSLVSLAGV